MLTILAGALERRVSSRRLVSQEPTEVVDGQELALSNLRQLTATLLQTAQWDMIARTQLSQWLHAVSRRVNTALTAAAA